MALSAAKRGIKQLCFTDHVEDCCRDDPLSYEPGSFEKLSSGIPAFFETADRLSGTIELCRGVELGSPNHNPERASEIVSDPGLDFVIASVHNLRGQDDFYFLDYPDMDTCRELTSRYLEEYAAIADLGHFDVLGHIGYTNRYMYDKGFYVDLTDYRDRLTYIFKALISKGKGMEVNTSSLRGSLGEPNPPIPLLKLYRELGGEIVTTGSDAHRVSDAGAGIAQVSELLAELGYKYICVYKERKPEFIKL
ncbi:MAG: histidinol-phosphatase HisJ family protein [Oscillospiraceae bacterium]|nr:histidinol-phosphatase HisJ family protein [Oscillospiraceae bacterium]